MGHGDGVLDDMYFIFQGGIGHKGNVGQEQQLLNALDLEHGDMGQGVAGAQAGYVDLNAASLRDEEAFARGHMLTWVDDFARCARRSKTAVLYPQMIEALAAFVRNDAVLLSEAACWAEEARDACGETIPGGLGALPGSPEAAAFAEVSDALAALARLRPFGIEDHELVSISV